MAWSSCPPLTLLFHVDIRYAIGASLVSVIATSSGAAAAYVKAGFSNIRVGMFLEVATTLGALVGAMLAGGCLPAIGRHFSVVLLWSPPCLRARSRARSDPTTRPSLAPSLRLDSTYPTPEGERAYNVHSSPRDSR